MCLGPLSFTNFNIEQLSFRVDEVDGSVWLLVQFQFHENEFFVGIVMFALGMIL
jgi:hypothetical protein